MSTVESLSFNNKSKHIFHQRWIISEISTSFEYLPVPCLGCPGNPYLRTLLAWIMVFIFYYTRSLLTTRKVQIPLTSLNNSTFPQHPLRSSQNPLSLILLSISPLPTQIVYRGWMRLQIVTSEKAKGRYNIYIGLRQSLLILYQLLSSSWSTLSPTNPRFLFWVLLTSDRKGMLIITLPLGYLSPLVHRYLSQSSISILPEP